MDTHITDLDAQLSAHAHQHGLLYCRFMGDWALLTHTKRQLRTGVRIMNRVLDQLDVEKAPDKTFIGRIPKGFDWLGYHIELSAARHDPEHTTSGETQHCRAGMAESVGLQVFSLASRPAAAVVSSVDSSAARRAPPVRALQNPTAPRKVVLSIAPKTLANHRAKLVRLYEQAASKEAVKEYVRRWRIWVNSGIQLNRDVEKRLRIGMVGAAVDPVGMCYRAQ